MMPLVLCGVESDPVSSVSLREALTLAGCSAPKSAPGRLQPLYLFDGIVGRARRKVTVTCNGRDGPQSLNYGIFGSSGNTDCSLVGSKRSEGVSEELWV